MNPIIKKALSICLVCMLGFQSVLGQASISIETLSHLGIVLPDTESEFEPEFVQALRFAYENGLTQYKTVEGFRPYEILTREQASKIVGVFAKNIMDFTRDSEKSCEFKDIETADPTLAENIVESCELGIFKGSPDGNYYPSLSLTKAQALTVIVRMFKKDILDETVTPRYLNYFIEAKNMDLTKEDNVYALDRPLTRYEMILMLYRFYVKLNILSISDITGETETLGIRMIDETIALIDSSLFLDKDIEFVYAEIRGEKYRLNKSELVSQFDDAFTRYGDVHLLPDGFVETGGTYVGVATFNLIKSLMIDGNIRPIVESDEYYKITLSQVVPFYKVELTDEKGVIIENIEISDAQLQSGSGEVLANPEATEFTEQPTTTGTVVVSTGTSLPDSGNVVITTTGDVVAVGTGDSTVGTGS